MPKKTLIPAIKNPFAQSEQLEFSVPDQVDYQPGPYEETLHEAHEIIQKPFVSAGLQIGRAHV